jgi:hypothetical protein
MKQMRALGCSVVVIALALSGCDGFYLAFDVDVGTRLRPDGFVPDAVPGGPVRDVPDVPGRVTPPADEAEQSGFVPPASCGAQPFGSLRYVYDVEAVGDRIAVASWEGTWLFGPAGGSLVDRRPSWRVRADGPDLTFLTHDRTLIRVDAHGPVERSSDRPLLDFVVRGQTTWATEEDSGDVLALTPDGTRVLADGRDATLMLSDADGAYVAMPSFGVVRIRNSGSTEALYAAAPTEGVFASVGHLTADADWLTFTAWPHGGLARVHKQSGAFERLLEVDDRLVLAAARHGDALYWLEQDTQGEGAMRVMHAAADGSGAGVFLEPACIEGGITLEVLGDSLFVMMASATLRVPL